MYFLSKWLDHLLLMTSCLVTVVTDHHWTCLNMGVRDKRTAIENVRCWCFSPKKKNKQKKNLREGWLPPPPPFPSHVRGLIQLLLFFQTRHWFKIYTLTTVHPSTDCWRVQDWTYLMLHVFLPTNHYACLATNQIHAGCEKVTESRQ